MARVVCPGVPHHITQRGVRRFDVERNPVRAGMVARAEDYPWSSARAHCGIALDPLVRNSGGESLIADWSAWLAEGNDKVQEQQIRARTFTGRPCGDDEFVRTIEAAVGRPLAPKKPGPKPLSPQATEAPLFPTTVDCE